MGQFAGRMEHEMSEMDEVLEEIGGGQVEVVLRAQEFVMRPVPNLQRPGEAAGIATGQDNVRFTARSYRRVRTAWAFFLEEDVMDPQTRAPRKVRSTVYIQASDILYLNVVSSLA